MQKGPSGLIYTLPLFSTGQVSDNSLNSALFHINLFEKFNAKLLPNFIQQLDGCNSGKYALEFQKS